MDIVFGMSADGRVFPDFVDDGDGALNHPVVGLSGLVGILETQLGLTAPRPSDAARIAAYYSALKLAGEGG
jgi:ATP-dependent helicase/nuclease subunit B